MKTFGNFSGLFFGIITVLIFASQLKAQEETELISPDTKLIENVQIFPNPVSDNTLYIKSPIEIRSVEVFNLLGKSVIRMEGFTSAKNNIEVDLDGFTKGVYLVHVIVENGQRFTEKIMVEN